MVGYLTDWAADSSAPKNAVLTYILATVAEKSVLLYLLGLSAFLLGKLLERGVRHEIWRPLQSQLDTLRKLAFPNHQADFQENHRVTLFEWQRWAFPPLPRSDWKWGVFGWGVGRAPWGGWLVPRLRSGVLGKVSGAAFFAPKTDSQRAEGIAGLAWATDAQQAIDHLPAVTQTTGSNASKYLLRSKTPEWMYRQHLALGKQLPRGLIGFPIRSASGRLWGALVIDSCEPDAIDEEQVSQAFQIIAPTLGILLEEIE